MSMRRSVVYFAYLGDEATEAGVVGQRLAFMERQLAWLADLVAATPDPIDVLVPYVAPRAWDAEVERAVTRHGFRIDPASLAADRRNSFEYPGFRALKALAHASAPDDLIYYCHSKGIVQLAAGKMGLFMLHTQVGLTADLGLLTADPSLTKAGLFPSRFGWCWYNFFWIKAGAMAALPVAESDDRYHFEALIGGEPRDKEGFRSVLSLIDQLAIEDSGVAIQHWYRPEETISPQLSAAYARLAAQSRPDIKG